MTIETTGGDTVTAATAAAAEVKADVAAEKIAEVKEVVEEVETKTDENQEEIERLQQWLWDMGDELWEMKNQWPGLVEKVEQLMVGMAALIQEAEAGNKSPSTQKKQLENAAGTNPTVSATTALPEEQAVEAVETPTKKAAEKAAKKIREWI